MASVGRWACFTASAAGFRSHLGLEPFYCQPGREGAHEKGGVEGQIGWFRRNHLVPVPEVDSIAELNALIDRWDIADNDRRIGSRPRTIGEMFAVERPLLRPLPDKLFETGRWFTPRVDRYSQISVRTNKYSVPVRFIDRQVRVLLHASELVVYDGRTEITRHERFLAKGGTRLAQDHDLEGLLRKPGALPGATALEQARATGKFTPIHDAWWAAARKAHGDSHGTRALITTRPTRRSGGAEFRDQKLAATGPTDAQIRDQLTPFFTTEAKITWPRPSSRRVAPSKSPCDTTRRNWCCPTSSSSIPRFGPSSRCGASMTPSTRCGWQRRPVTTGSAASS